MLETEISCFFWCQETMIGESKFDSFIITNGRKSNGDDHMQFKRKLYTIVVARISKKLHFEKDELSQTGRDLLNQ